MANLDNFTNIYADLAQSAYNNRKDSNGDIYNFANGLTDNQKEKLDANQSVKFDFPGAQDMNKNKIDTVYLQPDNTVKTVTEQKFFGKDKEYQKGLLTDEKAGYNSYYVTDTPTLNSETTHTYFATRGSDGLPSKLSDVKKGWVGNNMNDWVDNNLAFVENSYIPQAQLANEAMKQKIAEMRTKAPGATISMTGHSLGTMITIQAVANLSEKDMSKINKIILFQGPDARVSIDKMPNEQARKNIQQLEEEGKIHYYINAFDIVSMLNRNKKGVDEIGKVHYLLPKSFTSTFDTGNPGSSHDFGQYQLNPDGTPKEANLNEHGYIFAAGIKVSNLIDKYIQKLIKEKDGADSLSYYELVKLLTSGEYKDFEKEYAAIIAEAEVASKWNSKVSSLQKSIAGASGSKKIELRVELATEVANKAKKVGEDYVLILKNEQQEAEDEVDLVVREICEGAQEIQQYLESYEVEALIAPYKKNNLWEKGQAKSNTTAVKNYKEKLSSFSKTLTTISKNIQSYDSSTGKNLFTEK